MKNKGFTLVELLGVIIVLGVIAAITVPTINKTLKQNKQDLCKVQYENILVAAKAYGAEHLSELSNGSIITLKTLQDNGYIDKEIKNPSKKNEVIDENLKILVIKNGKKVEYKFKDTIACLGNSKYEIVYANGTAIYYDPVENSKCSESEAVSKTGKKSGCMKWYTFNDEEGAENVNMILDHNTTARIAWGSNGEMKEVAEALSNDTNDWNSSLNARLIEANEVAKITGNEAWSHDHFWYCLDTNRPDSSFCKKDRGTSEYAWLFDYTYKCTGYGCNVADSSTYSYWTSTLYDTENAWIVGSRSDLNYNSIGTNRAGVRPVITVSKSVIE